MARGDPPPRARTASASRSTRAPASSPPGSRSSTCPAAGSRCESGAGGDADRLQRRGLQPPRAAGRARRRRASRSRPRSDTEVVLRLLEREGLAALDRFNGQFAFAWWQPEPRRLTLVRDRFGVRPLHYALLDDGTLVFGSEAKALFASGEVAAEPGPRRDRRRLHALGRRGRRARAFRGVDQLPPGRRCSSGSAARIVERAALVDARLRRRASRPRRPRASCCATASGCACAPTCRSGTYLSGGLDSSLITALAQSETRRSSCAPSRSPSTTRATTSAPTSSEVAEALGTDTTSSRSAPARSPAPSPTSSATPRRRSSAPPRCRCTCSRARCAAQRHHGRDRTGEGADELFWGYDLFKEVVAARAQRSASPSAPREMLDELYPYLGAGGARRGPGLAPLPARDRRRRRSARSRT